MINVLRDSRETIACNVPLVSKVMSVNNVLMRGFRGILARIAYLASKENIVMSVLMVTVVTLAVSFKTILMYVATGH